jgi:hypothetical protein
MTKTTNVLKGKIENLKRVTTRTGNPMVTFTVGGTPCKAFGKGAKTVRQWVQVAPNNTAEFEGFFEKRSERFGEEFVVVHGKTIQTARIDNADRPVPAALQADAPGAALASAPSSPVQHIPAASERVGLEDSSPANIAGETEPPARRHEAPALKKDLPVTTGFKTFEEMERYYYATHPAAAEKKPS